MTPYRSERLGADHHLDEFDSGVEVLDEWLRRFARHADAANTGRTFVWVEPGPPRVVGHFTLAAHLVRRVDVPPAVGRGSPDAIPAVLIARLGLDRRLQGRGLGGELVGRRRLRRDGAIESDVRSCAPGEEGVKNRRARLQESAS